MGGRKSYGQSGGFTLIELSIMLVIIGLIIGGVLVGQSLISAATVRAQITQIEKYNTAANTFYGKYGYLPGDIPDPTASSFGFASRGVNAGEGDGNGVIESGFCVEALEAALMNGAPDIFNSDQGSQFTASAFTDVLAASGIRISMDGKGSYHDNIFTERLWRSVKYEEVYLKEYATLKEAEAGIAAYFAFYNATRPHQALAYQTPEQVHYALGNQQPLSLRDES
jgi:type II secretory pathway pseudopilin PulG